MPSLSEEAIVGYVRRYQTMVAARQQDRQQLSDPYRDIGWLVLTIDGLEPEKGHETLYTVREVNAKRDWHAEALLSSSTAEVCRLLVRAREMAEVLGKPVRLWMTDKKDVFVEGIAPVFPNAPHRYSVKHFLCDLAKPMQKVDSHAKVQMCKKVRGLRAIVREARGQWKHFWTQAKQEKMLRLTSRRSRSQGRPQGPLPHRRGCQNRRSE